MLEFYKAVEAADRNQRNIAATVLSGEYFGEKALISNGKLIWKSCEYGFFDQHREETEAIEESGRLRIGNQEVFCEILGREKKMVICGGGHVSIPIIQMGRMLGFHITVLEGRPVFADNARRAGASSVYCESFEDGLRRIEGDEDTYFIIVTRGHRYDQVCLDNIARKKHAYIGMIGSRKRVKLVKETIIANGGNPDVIEGIYSPIGLDIGAETPEEIAVAIMAEIIEVKNRKKCDGGYPKEILKEICREESGCTGEGDKRRHQVLATIVARKGSAPRKVGTKMLICPDGTCIGTIGGGCAEAEIYRKALEFIRNGRTEPGIYKVDMTGADAEEEGMVCGGVIEVLLEIIE